MQSTSSDGDLRERLTRMEVAEQYAKRVMQDQGNSINRIGTNVLNNSRGLELVQHRLNRIEPTVKEFSEIKKSVQSVRRALVMLRGLGNTIGTAIIFWLLFTGNLSKDGIQAALKLAGL